MYRTDFWTLWEKARVGYFKRTSCILSSVKQITSPGGMHETSAQAWKDPEESGGEGDGRGDRGIHVIPWLIHVNV